MGRGCPQLHNSTYSSHLFDAPGSEIQGEDNESDLTSDQVLTATQESLSLFARTCETRINFP